jgi:hypothetical protein
VNGKITTNTDPSGFNYKCNPTAITAQPLNLTKPTPAMAMALGLGMSRKLPVSSATNFADMSEQ